MYKRVTLVFFSFLLLSLARLPVYSQHSPFRVLSPQDSFSLKAGEVKKVVLTLQIPEKYFVYRDKTALEFLNLEGVFVKNIEYPPVKTRQDPFFKKPSQVFEGNSNIEVTFQASPDAEPGKRTLEALLKLQGCSDTLCYPEESHLIVFHLDVVGSGSSYAKDPTTPTSWRDLIHTQNFDQVMEQGWWVVLLVVFLGGFLTSLTPCVLPLIPITLMIIGVRAESPLRRNLILSMSLVLGLALTYSILGIVAVALGKSLGFIFQEKGFVIFLAVLYFSLSLSMLGFYEIHLPSALRHRLNHVKGHGLMGAFLSGAASGVLAAPCAGPVIGSLLLFVATRQNYFTGLLLLFVYALGMGLLFVLLGTGYGTLLGQTRFRKFPLSLWIKRGLGIILLLGSFFYLNTVLPLEKRLTSFLRPMTEAVVWIPSESQGLEKAGRENKVALIDFYAEWCAPCKELEIGFFRKPAVVALLQQMVPIRLDATFGKDPETKAVLNKYKVVGWPTVVFVGPSGKVLKELTVVSYNPEKLFENMQKALQLNVTQKK